jgi:hypothetical protein
MAGTTPVGASPMAAEAALCRLSREPNRSRVSFGNAGPRTADRCQPSPGTTLQGQAGRERGRHGGDPTVRGEPDLARRADSQTAELGACDADDFERHAVQPQRPAHRPRSAPREIERQTVRDHDRRDARYVIALGQRTSRGHLDSEHREGVAGDHRAFEPARTVAHFADEGAMRERREVDLLARRGPQVTPRQIGNAEADRLQIGRPLHPGDRTPDRGIEEAQCNQRHTHSEREHDHRAGGECGSARQGSHGESKIGNPLPHDASPPGPRDAGGGTHHRRRTCLLRRARDRPRPPLLRRSRGRRTSGSCAARSG